MSEGPSDTDFDFTLTIRGASITIDTDEVLRLWAVCDVQLDKLCISQEKRRRSILLCRLPREEAPDA